MAPFGAVASFGANGFVRREWLRSARLASSETDLKPPWKLGIW
jgi:hypothetical protein